MRKLKLEIQLSIDGFAADSEGKTDWMIWDWKPEWNWDKSLQKLHTDLQTSSDTILLGKKMATSGFFEHWEKVAENKKDVQYTFAQAINKMQKFVFTKSLKKSRWQNTELIKGGLVTSAKLKKKKGKDIIVYGGTSFVSSLIKEQLIDEYYFIINPTVLGKGKPVFRKIVASQNLILKSATAYTCGVAVIIYTKP